MLDLDALQEDLARDEGCRLKPYRDTVGKLTVGFGRNLDDNGITEPEAHFMLRTDVLRAVSDLDRFLPWWRKMSEPRQRALANMCFNLGIPRLLTFKKMLAALEAGDHETAAREALDSRWAVQVGDRARRIARMIRTGEG